MVIVLLLSLIERLLFSYVLLVSWLYCSFSETARRTGLYQIYGDGEAPIGNNFKDFQDSKDCAVLLLIKIISYIMLIIHSTVIHVNK